MNINEEKYIINKKDFKCLSKLFKCKYGFYFFIYNIKYIFLLILLLCNIICSCNLEEEILDFNKYQKKVYLDLYDRITFNRIRPILDNNSCSEMWGNQREFLNGIIRKFRPKKVLEIGVKVGGSSIIILNAINDIKNSKLYSIDISSDERIGKCVRQFTPNLMNKWTLFTGNIATEFMSKIGNNIDIVLIDSAHFEPGEIMDFLMILPFLKEKAIVIFHDIGNQITLSMGRNEWAPYIIFNAIRGKKILPSGNKILTQDIGAVILDKNQKKYYHDYFRLLGGQWQYFPKEIFIKSLKIHFSKYYDKECLIMFEETTKFNRKFVKDNPKNNLYKSNSD